MARIFWDTNLFVYWFEAHEDWGPVTKQLHARMVQRRDVLLTSWLTVGEVLVRPRSERDALLERRYLALFHSRVVVMTEFGREAAMTYASLRAGWRLRSPDALQLACAAAAGVDLFVTNDKRLHALVVPGIDFICGLDRLPL